MMILFALLGNSILLHYKKERKRSEVRMQELVRLGAARFSRSFGECDRNSVPVLPLCCFCSGITFLGAVYVYGSKKKVTYRSLSAQVSAMDVIQSNWDGEEDSDDADDDVDATPSSGDVPSGKKTTVNSFLLASSGSIDLLPSSLWTSTAIIVNCHIIRKEEYGGDVDLSLLMLQSVGKNLLDEFYLHQTLFKLYAEMHRCFLHDEGLGDLRVIADTHNVLVTAIEQNLRKWIGADLCEDVDIDNVEWFLATLNLLRSSRYCVEALLQRFGYKVEECIILQRYKERSASHNQDQDKEKSSNFLKTTCKWCLPDTSMSVVPQYVVYIKHVDEELFCSGMKKIRKQQSFTNVYGGVFRVMKRAVGTAKFVSGLVGFSILRWVANSPQVQMQRSEMINYVKGLVTINGHDTVERSILRELGHQLLVATTSFTLSLLDSYSSTVLDHMCEGGLELDSLMCLARKDTPPNPDEMASLYFSLRNCFYATGSVVSTVGEKLSTCIEALQGIRALIKVPFLAITICFGSTYFQQWVEYLVQRYSFLISAYLERAQNLEEREIEDAVGPLLNDQEDDVDEGVTSNTSRQDQCSYRESHEVIFAENVDQRILAAYRKEDPLKSRNRGWGFAETTDKSVTQVMEFTGDSLSGKSVSKTTQFGLSLLCVCWAEKLARDEGAWEEDSRKSCATFSLHTVLPSFSKSVCLAVHVCERSDLLLQVTSMVRRASASDLFSMKIRLLRSVYAQYLQQTTRKRTRGKPSQNGDSFSKHDAQYHQLVPVMQIQCGNGEGYQCVRLVSGEEVQYAKASNLANTKELDRFGDEDEEGGALKQAVLGIQQEVVTLGRAVSGYISSSLSLVSLKDDVPISTHVETVGRNCGLFPHLFYFYGEDGMEDYCDVTMRQHNLEVDSLGKAFKTIETVQEAAKSGIDSSGGAYAASSVTTHGTIGEFMYTDEDTLDTTYSIEFKNVSYSVANRTILDDVSFFIPQGAFVGLVGKSGCGKSTLLSLLLRIYQPQSGEILLNGRDIRQFPPRWLRRRVAYVAQQVKNLGTVKTNIALGDLLQTDIDAQIPVALAAAQAQEFVESKPLKLHSSCDKTQFSGGENQRISIARALLKDGRRVRFCLLDEATSAIDVVTERSIQKALTEKFTEGASTTLASGVKKKKTVLCVAHRLSTLRDADLILVLSDGKLVEKGTWSDLLTRSPEQLEGGCDHIEKNQKEPKGKLSVFQQLLDAQSLEAADDTGGMLSTEMSTTEMTRTDTSSSTTITDTLTRLRSCPTADPERKRMTCNSAAGNRVAYNSLIADIRNLKQC